MLILVWLTLVNHVRTVCLDYRLWVAAYGLKILWYNKMVNTG